MGAFWVSVLCYSRGGVVGECAVVVGALWVSVLCCSGGGVVGECALLWRWGRCG